MLTIKAILKRLDKLQNVWEIKKDYVFSDKELNELKQLKESNVFSKPDLTKISKKASAIYNFYYDQATTSPLRANRKKTAEIRENERKKLFHNAIKHMEAVLEKLAITPSWSKEHRTSDLDSQSDGEFKGDASDSSVISASASSGSDQKNDGNGSDSNVANTQIRTHEAGIDGTVSLEGTDDAGQKNDGNGSDSNVANTQIRTPETEIDGTVSPEGTDGANDKKNDGNGSDSNVANTQTRTHEADKGGQKSQDNSGQSVIDSNPTITDATDAESRARQAAVKEPEVKKLLGNEHSKLAGELKQFWAKKYKERSGELKSTDHANNNKPVGNSAENTSSDKSASKPTSKPSKKTVLDYLQQAVLFLPVSLLSGGWILLQLLSKPFVQLFKVLWNSVSYAGSSAKVTAEVLGSCIVAPFKAASFKSNKSDGQKKPCCEGRRNCDNAADGIEQESLVHPGL